MWPDQLILNSLRDPTYTANQYTNVSTRFLQIECFFLVVVLFAGFVLPQSVAGPEAENRQELDEVLVESVLQAYLLVVCRDSWKENGNILGLRV